MATTIKQAYLFGQVGKAIYFKDNQDYILSLKEDKPRPCRAGEVGLLSDACAEFTVEYELTETELRDKLRRANQGYKALSFLLNGLDGTLTKVRSKTIKRANELCQDEQTYTFVRHRLLGYPLPNDADIEGAINLTDEAGTTHLHALYTEVKENRVALKTLHTAWKKVVSTPDFFINQAEQTQILRNFVDNGVMTDLVKTAISHDLRALNRLISNWVKHPDFKYSRLLIHLKDELIRLMLLEPPDSFKSDNTVEEKCENNIPTEKPRLPMVILLIFTIFLSVGVVALLFHFHFYFDTIIMVVLAVPPAMLMISILFEGVFLKLVDRLSRNSGKHVNSAIETLRARNGKVTPK